MSKSFLGPFLDELASLNPTQFELPRQVLEDALPASERKKKKKHKKCVECEEKCKWKSETANCNICNRCYHVWCLDPPLLRAPASAWTCPDHGRQNVPLETHVLPEEGVVLDFVPEFASSNRRKGRPFRAYQERAVTEARDVEEQQVLEEKRLREKQEFVNMLSGLQEDLVGQNEDVLSNKVERARATQEGSWDPIEVMMEVRLKELEEKKRALEQQQEQERAARIDTSKASLREYVSKTNAVIQKASSMGVPLYNTGFTLEDVVMGRIPTMNELESITPDLLARMDPLFVQFLAWQRMIQINEERSVGGLDSVKIARSEDNTASVVVRKEIERIRTLEEPKRKILTESIAKLKEAEQFALGGHSVKSFLDKVAGVSIEQNLPFAPPIQDPTAVILKNNAMLSHPNIVASSSSSSASSSAKGSNTTGRKRGRPSTKSQAQDESNSNKKQVKFSAKKGNSDKTRVLVGTLRWSAEDAAGNPMSGQCSIHEDEVLDIGKTWNVPGEHVPAVNLKEVKGSKYVSRVHMRIRKKSSGEWEMQIWSKNGLRSGSGVAVGPDGSWKSMKPLYEEKSKNYEFQIVHCVFQLESKH